MLQTPVDHLVVSSSESGIENTKEYNALGLILPGAEHVMRVTIVYTEIPM